MVKSTIELSTAAWEDGTACRRTWYRWVACEQARSAVKVLLAGDFLFAFQVTSKVQWNCIIHGGDRSVRPRRCACWPCLAAEVLGSPPKHAQCGLTTWGVCMREK